MKLATLFRDSCAELKHARTITTAAMFAAVSVILSAFTIVAGPYLKIGISTIANEFVYMLYGPVVGACYGGILDLMKYVISPTGEFFPGFTLTAVAGGLLYGAVLYGRPLTFRRVLLAKFLVILVCNILLNSIWVNMLYGKALAAILPARILKNVIQWPVDSLIFYVLASRLEAMGALKAIKGRAGRKAEDSCAAVRR